MTAQELRDLHHKTMEKLHGGHCDAGTYVPFGKHRSEGTRCPVCALYGVYDETMTEEQKAEVASVTGEGA